MKDGGLKHGEAEDDRWSRARASRTSSEGVRRKARQFGSAIKVTKGKREVNAKSPIKLMTPEAKKDEKITIRVEGDDAEKVVDVLVELVTKSEHRLDARCLLRGLEVFIDFSPYSEGSLS